ncbi:MAG: hypothetical protein L0Z50_36970 [Verrucomicrobiales bacterium]|nr:hypothetical protein [Verrucomicrobiales bacterium]
MSKEPSLHRGRGWLRWSAPLRGFSLIRALLLLCCAGLQSLGAQTELRIVSANISAGTLALQWTATSSSYEVQSTANLKTPNWRPVLVTARTNAILNLPGTSGFFRVLTRTANAPSIDDATRFRIFDAITQKITALSEQEAEADVQEFVDFLRGFGEFIDAGVTKNESAWARFSDGRLVIIVNNRPLASDEELARVPSLEEPTTPNSAGVFDEGNIPPLGSKSRIEKAQSRVGRVGLATELQSRRVAPSGLGLIVPGRPVGIPESRNAVLFKASGLGLEAPALDRLTPGLRAHGYQIQGGEAGVFELMAVQVLDDDIGVFYIDTHGVEIEDVIPFALLTSTWADPDAEARLQGSLERREIGYAFLGPKTRRKLDGTRKIIVTRRPLYCILPPFVPAYWKFGKNSFVYMDTCDSATSGAAPFIQACAEVGASVYAGWTESVYDGWALSAAKMVFDLLLGDSQYYKFTPPTRAFDWVAIKARKPNIHAGTLINPFDISPRSGAELVFFNDTWSGNGRFGLLAPSIYWMHVDESKEELQIVGLFDFGAPATIRIEGNGGSKEIQAMPRRITGSEYQPSPTEIICPLPAKQKPSAGNVTVIQRGHASNTVPLTEWWLEAEGHKYFSVGQPNPSSTIKFNLHFRTDVHASRQIPVTEAKFPGNFADAARDSTCTITDASGIYFDPNGIRTVQWFLDKPIELPINYDAPPNTRFAGRASFASDGKVDLILSAFAANGMRVVERIDHVENTYSFEPGTRTFPPGRSSLDPTSFAIQAGEGPAAGDSGIFKWQQAPATFAPNESTPGYGAVLGVRRGE